MVLYQPLKSNRNGLIETASFLTTKPTAMKRKKARWQQPKNSAPPLPDIDATKWYNVLQVCRIFDIEERTLRNWRKAQKITCYKFGRRVRFCKTDIDQALARYRQLGFL